ncbi:MAG: DEAD/DEAH box helicase [bacterium]
MPHTNIPGNDPVQGSAHNHTNFDGLGIAPKILVILDQIKFKVPTAIQAKVIPLAINGDDIVGIAQTGTGKTHAFAVPILQTLARVKGTALVLAPTRELALQINEAFKILAQPFGIYTACLIGGDSMHKQLQALQRKPRIVIGTPGRVQDHIDRRTVSFNDTAVLVLDEADRMLDMGFAPQVKKILSRVPKQRQTMLFSATMAGPIMDMASQHMKLPVSVEIAPSGTTAERITQELFIIKKEEKPHLLGKMLAKYRGSVLLFSRTKRNAKRVAKMVREMGHTAIEIHSNRTLAQRRQALDGFKAGLYKVLVATDIASRGIDVTGIEVVINYDLPDDTENYVHRIGRTGRAGHAGHAISFATPDQRGNVRDIESLIRTSLPVSKHPGISDNEFNKPSVVYSSGTRRSRMRSRRFRHSRR